MTELEFEPRLRQLVDWSAAAWAALIGGTLFLLINLILTTTALDGNPWIVIRLIASIVMGPEILAPPATFHAGALAAALVIHYVLSFAFTAVVVIALHRWGLIVGILGGALMGLFLYLINFYSFTYFFPQFFAMNTWVMAFTHVLFGAAVGGIYEALEVVVYVSTDGQPVEKEA